MSFKSGFVAIVGRPNVGKSTFLNQVLKQKVAIISDKVQTTRRRIRGILTDEKAQIIFVDTPGVHKPTFKLGEYLMDEAKLAIPDADVLLFLVDAQQKPGSGDKWIVENILNLNKPLILVANKVDLIKDLNKRDEYLSLYKEMFVDIQVQSHFISAKTGRNVHDLVNSIIKLLPEGPKYFPDDEVTDQSLRSISEEIIREKILLETVEELPHSVAVNITNYEVSDKITRIIATIFVERDSQKGIVIGKNGDMLKKIGTLSRIDIEDMIEGKVFLQLHVKVKKNWRKNDSALRQLGYNSK